MTEIEFKWLTEPLAVLLTGKYGAQNETYIED